MNNNGPSDQATGTHVGPAEASSIENRRIKKRRHHKSFGISGGVVTADKP